jgi:hypothetical protein
MATKNEGSKVVDIKENPAKNEPAKTNGEGQETNGATETEKVSFWKHPIKWTKKKFEDHPVAATTTSVVGIGLLAFAAKCIAEALGGENSEENNEETDVLDDEEEDNEEDE